MSSALDLPETPKVKRAAQQAADAASAGLEDLRRLAGESTLPHFLREIEQGRPAIWGGGSWEAPLLYACGVLPVPLNELWREGSREAEVIGESQFHVPSEYCSMIKAVLGRLRLLKDGPLKRILHFGGACEPISIALELTRKDGYDVFCIEGVTSFREQPDRDAAMEALLISELDRVARWLTGQPADEDRVAEEIRRKNRIIRKVRRIVDLRAAEPKRIPHLAVLQLLAGTGHCFGDPKRFERVLDRILQELEAAGRPRETSSAIPLVFAGGAAGGLEAFRSIEEAGAAVVGWVTYNSIDRTFDESLPPLRSIARYLLQSQQAGELGELGGAPALPRRERIESEVRRVGARGVIASGITGCPYNSIVQQVERQHFKKLGIPMIALETSVHREPPSEEQLIKLKTFVEMLK